MYLKKYNLMQSLIVKCKYIEINLMVYITLVSPRENELKTVN